MEKKMKNSRTTREITDAGFVAMVQGAATIVAAAIEKDIVSSKKDILEFMAAVYNQETKY